MRLRTFLPIVTMMLLIIYTIGFKKGKNGNIDHSLVLSISPLGSESDVTF